MNERFFEKRNIDQFKARTVFLGAGAISYFISKSDEIAKNSPDSIGDAIERSQLPKIPENIALINWYGADLAAPFGFYFLARLKGLGPLSSAAVILSVAMGSETLQYATRNAPSAATDGGRFDPIDLACYSASIAGALAIDRYLSRQKKTDVNVQESGKVIPPEPTPIKHRKRKTGRNSKKRKSSR